MIHVDQQHDFSDIALLERAAQMTLDHAGASTSLTSSRFSFGSENADLTIVLTDDAQLHELNRDYLGVDAPTDVLSFPADENDPESGVHYLGDILISIPRAKKQAKAAGHPLEAEVQLLVVHGTLHLLGHDHAKVREKARMWKAQAAVMSKLGLGHIKVQES